MPSESVTSPSSLVWAHAPDHIPPPASRLARSEGLCRLSSVPAGKWPFPTLSLRVLSQMPGPLSRWVVQVHLPVTSLDHIGLLRSAANRLPTTIRQATSRRDPFTRPQSFRYVQASKFACHPSRSYHGISAYAWQLWRFHSSRTCVVAFTRIEYASRPNRATDGTGTFTP